MIRMVDTSKPPSEPPRRRWRQFLCAFLGHPGERWVNPFTRRCEWCRAWWNA